MSSTFTCDPRTRAELDASPSKNADAAVIQAALGNTRRIVCKRDPSNSATDPWETGTIFRNVGSTGPLRIVAGKILGLGLIKGTTVSLAADMSTGKSVVRISGNGRWIQGSLGLVGSTADFTVRGNFTSSNGFGLAAGFAISGKRLKPSGVGPAAPIKTADMAHTFELWDWTNSANPSLVTTTSFDVREDDYCFQDPERALEMGDVAWHRCNQPMVWGPFEFAPHLFLSDKSNTEAGTAHFQQVMIANAYRGTWEGYPDAAKYNRKTHVLNPPPFKIVMKNQNGTVLHTFQMQDGLPINDPSLHSWNLPDVNNPYAPNRRDATHPARPRYNAFMALPWQSARARMSNYAKKLYPGMETAAPFGYRPSMGKGHFSVNGNEPVLLGAGSWALNGLNNMWALPRWPLPDASYLPSVIDPFVPMVGEYNRSGASSQYAPWASGWDYEPGSYSGHNRFSAPGGLRFDRGVMPSVLAMWMTYPNGNRAQENTPWRDMVEGYMLAHFNHSCRAFTDPTRLYLDTNENLINDKWSVTGLYYGPYGPWREKNIQINGTLRGSIEADAFDQAGNLVLNGDGRDPLHNYTNSAWGALLLNSPMHGILSKTDTFYSWAMDYPVLSEYNPMENYGVRVQAWQWLVYPLAWKVAADHPLAFTQREIEDRFAALMEKYWIHIWKPLKIDNDQRPFFQTLRTMGTTFQGDGGGGGGGRLGFYMGHVLQVMKQTGFWSAMMARGGHVKDVLELEIEMRDRYCFDNILDTHMMSNGSYHFYHKGDFGGGVPQSWADWNAKYPSESFASKVEYGPVAPGADPYSNPIYTYYPANRTLYTDQNGNWSPLLEGPDHNMFQYPSIRKNYFPEYPNPRLDAAIEKMRSIEQIALNAVNAASTPLAKKDTDHNQRLPHLVNIAAPAPGDLGPA